MSGEQAASTTNVTKKEFEDLNWDDVSVVEGELKEIQSVDVKKLLSKDLRTVCSRLKIRGVKNATKSVMIERIVEYHGNKEKYANVAKALATSKTRKEPQCTHRLINVLFSDEFAEKFAHLGDVADRVVLDSGKAANDQHFWEDVQKAFAVEDELIDTIHFRDDDVFHDMDDIDATKIVPHDWKKLRAIWKGINADYKGAISRFSLSGTHSSNFYDFCNGKQDTYYLRKYLELKPNLTGFVEADLPEDTFIESIDKVTPKLSPSSSSSKRKRRENGDTAVAEALRELNNSKMQTEIAKKSLIF